MRRPPVLVVILAFVSGAGAQSAPPSPKARTECRDSPVVPRLEGCTIRDCDEDEYDEAELQSGPVDGSGDFPKRLVEGRLSVLTYLCPRTTSMDAIARRSLAALRKAGYLVVYSGDMYHTDLPGFTARKGRHWIQVVSEAFEDGTGYTVTAVDAVVSEPMSSPKPPGARRTRKTTR
jgi:hypothetical protein